MLPGPSIIVEKVMNKSTGAVEEVEKKRPVTMEEIERWVKGKISRTVLEDEARSLDNYGIDINEQGVM